jgi:hypothetical protein
MADLTIEEYELLKARILTVQRDSAPGFKTAAASIADMNESIGRLGTEMRRLVRLVDPYIIEEDPY